MTITITHTSHIEGVGDVDFVGTMYGVGNYHDTCTTFEYDPWVHAEHLGLPVIYRELPDPEMLACYSHDHRAIFMRSDLHGAAERSALAHEIVHAEHNDVGYSEMQEERADRIAARRLIRPARIEQLQYSIDATDDPAAIALELNVTEEMMGTYIKLMQSGRIRLYA